MYVNSEKIDKTCNYLVDFAKKQNGGLEQFCMGALTCRRVKGAKGRGDNIGDKLLV